MLSRLHNDRGMTLVELLAGMAIAMIVSLAGFSLIEVVMKRSGEVSDRVESTQRARGAMDDITRSLRSQVCVLRADPALMTSARTIYAATPSSVTFFGDTADESWKAGTTTMPVPTLRTIAMTGSTITETIRPGVVDAAHPGLNAVTFASATGQRTRTELTDAQLATDAAGDPIPLFRFYAFNTATPPQPTVLLTPGAGGLTEAQLQQVAKVSIAYRVRAAGKSTTRGSIVLHDDITIRTVDPNSSAPKPTCI